MSSDEFEAYRNRIDPENAAIHINIEDNNQANMNNRLNFPIGGSNGLQNNQSPSSSFHTMLNRVVRHTNGHRNHRFMFNNISPTAIARSLMSNSNNFRYTPLNENSPPNDNVRILFDNEDRRHEQSENPFNRLETNTHNFLLNNTNAENSNTLDAESNVNIANQAQHSNDGDNEAQPQNHAPLEEDNNNVFSDILVRVLGNFVRYLPFLVILFVKFIHDHLIGILDIAILQIDIWFINRSLSNQVSKFSQKNYFILLRDFVIVATTVTCRLLLTSSTPDAFGLVINPPSDTIAIEVSSFKPSGDSPALNALKKYIASPSLRTAMDSDTENPIYVTRVISFGLLIYYIAVNDLLLKLLTILTKIIITMLPTKLLRHSQRARLYVLVEYFSQLYRSLVPIRQWVLFLFKSYTGLEVISGILFSAFYMGAKGFEFVSRGKVLKEAFFNFVRNMDYERKPTKVELDAAGQICPICHDAFNTPVILTCNHIFCDDCVGRWFKREQTCPMCRAKVSEDPQWQDGTTSFFYQLC